MKQQDKIDIENMKEHYESSNDFYKFMMYGILLAWFITTTIGAVILIKIWEVAKVCLK